MARILTAIVLSGSVFVASVSFNASALAASSRKASVFFVEPQDKTTISGKVKVKFGLKGMKIAPAGSVEANAGHHHLILDGGPVAKGEVIPADATHLHFGKGQTETEVELPKGAHALTLQFADGAHRSYGPEMSATIHVNAE